MEVRTQNLLFLLSAAPLSVGCIVTSTPDDFGTDGDVGTEDATTDDEVGTESSDDAETTTGDGDGDGDTADATDDATDATGDATDDLDTAETYSDTYSETYSDTGEYGACETYGTWYGTCTDDARAGYYAASECNNYLESAYETYGTDCVIAFEALMTCISGLDCAAIEDSELIESGCGPELAALDANCV